MPRRKELPYSPIGAMHADGVRESQLEIQGGAGRTPAQSAMQALMECVPHEQPRSSAEDLLPLREVIQDAIDTALTPRERWIFDACTVERRSIRAIALDLGWSKSTVDRVNHLARQKLAVALSNEPLIKHYLEGR